MALQILEGHPGFVYVLVFLPDRKLIASTSLDGTIKLWEAYTGAALQSFETLTSSNAGFLCFLIGGHIDQSCDNRKGKWSNCMWRKVLSGEKEKNSIERNET